MLPEQTTLKPGAHWLIPFVDTPRKVNWRYMNQNSVVKISTDRIDMREHVIDCNAQTVCTHVVLFLLFLFLWWLRLLLWWWLLL